MRMSMMKKKTGSGGVKPKFVGVPIYFVDELEFMEILGYRRF